MTATLDTRGRRCPVPILLLSRKAKELEDGATIRVLADDPDFRRDVQAWCERSGHVVARIETEDGHDVIFVELGQGERR